MVAFVENIFQVLLMYGFFLHIFATGKNVDKKCRHDYQQGLQCKRSNFVFFRSFLFYIDFKWITPFLVYVH